MENQIASSPFGMNLAVWARLRPEDFDGHTEFATMNAEQRLTWLSELVRFVHDARQCRETSQRSLD